MRHGILFGEHELTIDEKHRLLIPSDVRKAIDAKHEGDGFFLIIGLNLKPWVYPARDYEELVSQLPDEMVPGDERLMYDQINFAMASRIDLDKQGRILIPDKLLRLTHIEKSVTLIGAKNHLEIWNRGEWEQHQQELLGKWKEVASRARPFMNQSPREGSRTV